VDRARYLPLFLEEATDHLAELGRALLALEKDPSAPAALELCFRMAHSIKGMAAAMSLDPITACAHALEDRLARARSAGGVDPVVELPLWFSALDRLERLLRSVRDTGECVAEPAGTEDDAAPAGLKKKLRRKPLAA
jgi:two-component system chemotaxis sensor kinase CheA